MENLINRSKRLNLFLLSQNQTQKEILVNENFAKLECLYSNSLEDIDMEYPPKRPTYGMLCSLGANPKQEWRGNKHQLALYITKWHFITPNEGMLFWVKSKSKLIMYVGNKWRNIAVSFEENTTQQNL